ncbi:D-alanyl-D-alanine carboxypeptidase/D-alanyl-D-alanine endopeptidase [Rummeliibacillus pycnus]|uniref:D-alanyl-D-alanine carboxypeptidase/D-alanyl-D-alanine endopeptidase n=1 Tax=Rummeliibacillus pycnus TaxID=101070 RepID=UPI0014738B4E|nr:D-alanyl-D-alanine carboxypeptidase/D-alanyl-D-alanine-endopeptidase [Rummeliibacillus pycnus]
MKKNLSMFLTTCLVTLGLFAGHISAEASTSQIQTLDQSVKKIVDEKMAGADVSLAIRDEKGNVIYDLNGNQKQKPASNMKLLTTSAALETLGENYRFKTNAYYTGKIKNGVLKGDIYLQGTGDPTLNKEDLEQFVGSIAALGIKQIDGRIVADDYWFDQDLLTPGIAEEDESYYYAAPITALTTSPNSDYDSGTIIVEAKGEEVGKKPTLTITPELGDLVIENNAQTVEAGKENTLTIERQFRTNRIIVSGNLPVDKSLKEWVTVQNPTIHTLTTFKNLLEQNKIQYSKDKLYRAKTPNSAKLITQKQSMPLSQLLIPYMKLSNNGIADILVKTMGQVKMHKGSTEAGLKVLKQYAKSRHLNIGDWSFEDGSGMSHSNRVSSIHLTQLLFMVQKEKWFNTYFTSLPVAANPERMIGGTLRNRLKSPLTAGKVIAKTGSLTGVNTLSGYLKGSSGKTYTFSILVQNKSGTIPVIDEIVEVMAKQL